MITLGCLYLKGIVGDVNLASGVMKVTGTMTALSISNPSDERYSKVSRLILCNNSLLSCKHM